MAPTLAQELIDSILDHLYNDKKTLGVACAVARNWVLPCRYHLFRDLRVRHPIGTSFDDFASFLASSPATAAYVRRLAIEGDMHNVTFPKVLSHLPNLSALYLRDWHSSLEPATTSVRNTFKLDTVLLDIAYHPRSMIPIKRFVGYRTDDEDSEESGEDEENADDNKGSGPDEGGEDRFDENSAGGVDQGDQYEVDGLEGSEREVDPPREFEGRIDDSEGVDQEVASLDWQDVPEGDHNPEGDIVYDAYPDAARLINILSFFSEIKELTIDCQHLEPGKWEIPLSQLVVLIPDVQFPMVHSLTLTCPSTSESFFLIFRRLLPLSALESLAIWSNDWPMYPDLCALMQEARNLSKFTLFVDDYCKAPSRSAFVVTETSTGYENSWIPGLENCSSIQSLFISPSHSPTNVEDYDSENNREELGYASDTDIVHFYDWDGIQTLLEAGFPRIHHLSIQICSGTYGNHPRHLMQCLRAIRWAWLEDFLINRYPDFRTLTFHYNAKKTDKRGVTKQALENYIREHLPTLQRRGAVFIKKPVFFPRQHF